MSIVEVKGGPITHRYLMNKSKSDLAHMILERDRLTAKIIKDLLDHAVYDRERDDECIKAVERAEGWLTS